MFLQKEDLFHIPRFPVYSHFPLWYCCCCHTSQFKAMSTSNIFPWCKWIFINCLVQQTWSILVAVLPATQCHLLHVCFSPSQKRSMCSSSVFIIYLCAEVHKHCCVFTLKQAMKEIYLAMHQEIKRSVERTSFGSLVPGSKRSPSSGCRSSNATNPIRPEDWRIFIPELMPISSKLNFGNKQQLPEREAAQEVSRQWQHIWHFCWWCYCWLVVHSKRHSMMLYSPPVA